MFVNAGVIKISLFSIRRKKTQVLGLAMTHYFDAYILTEREGFFPFCFFGSTGRKKMKCNNKFVQIVIQKVNMFLRIGQGSADAN